jgi:endonuclease/exonuclease/phosphatase (EEP) superfamily protein YafD
LFLTITQLVLLFVLLFTVAGYLGRLHKYTELVSHFRIQYLLVSTACLLSFLFHAQLDWAIVAALTLVINLAEVAPLYCGGNQPASECAGGRRLKLILANVNAESVAYARFVAFARRHKPDVLVVQEVDDAWCESLQSLRSLCPFSQALPRKGGSGMAIFSRFQIERLALDLPEGDARPGLLVKLDVESVSVALLSIHPRAPIRPGHFELRNEMLASTVNCLNLLAAPKLLVGDLNVTPWSPYYQCLAKQARLLNVRKGFGPLPSWPTFLFFKWLMIPLDHCLVSEDIKVSQVQTGELIGSDHLPLIIEIVIPLNRPAGTEFGD